MEAEIRNCLFCGKELKNKRKDAKFCNDYCRTAQNNKRRSGNLPEVIRVDKILHHNYEILAALLKDKRYQKTGKDFVIVPVSVLQRMGFKADFHTQVRGKEYKYCYDLSFRALNDKEMLIGHAPDHVLSEQLRP